MKKGTDTSMLWKATVRIACVKVNPTTRQIESHKLLNLKQFLCVFRTFQANLQSLISSEKKKVSTFKIICLIIHVHYVYSYNYEQIIHKIKA